MDICADLIWGHIIMMIIILLWIYLIPYSQKYWQELNLVVEPKIAISRILADLNLAVWYRIAICIYYASIEELLANFNLAVVI